MHLNEMKNMDDLLAVLCDLVEPMTEISQDEEISTLLSDGLKKASVSKNSMAQVAALLPFQCALLKKHRDQAVQIIAATTGRTVEEVEAQQPTEIVADVRRFITKDFLAFFR